MEYLRFLDIANASTFETIDHLESLHAQLPQLSKSIHQFIRGVNAHHNEERR